MDGLHFREVLVALAKLDFLAIAAGTQTVLIDGH
jgi:hypothetical protein